MQLKNGFHLGKIGKNYIVWNSKKHKEFKAKNLREAKKEAERIINNFKK